PAVLGSVLSLGNTDISIDTKCTMAPESRFDCARDRLLSQRECEERGCCYVPLPNTVGPPWCFYPSCVPEQDTEPQIAPGGLTSAVVWQPVVIGV
uniref:P-type domain-containing protein n=1 Tax=Monopterus albus TaxID=43700 RepID=A0A3Q3J250_MONAL